MNMHPKLSACVIRWICVQWYVISGSPAPELRIHLVSSHSHAGVDVDAHVGQGRLELRVRQVQGLQDLAADRQKRLFRPGPEPVDGAAVDEGREHAAPGPEGAPHWAHGQHAVQVVPHTIDEGCPACFLHMCAPHWLSLLYPG